VSAADRAIRFDVACRLQQAAPFLRSSYAADHRVSFVDGRTAKYVFPARPGELAVSASRQQATTLALTSGELIIQPMDDVSPLPFTSRWAYEVRVSDQISC
jgi:hypothetical protein